MVDLQDWKRLCPSLRVLDARNADYIYRQGDKCRDAYIVARGHVKLSRVSAAGIANTMIILPAENIFGAALIRDSDVRVPDTATAKGTTRLYRVPVRQLMAAMSADSGIGAFVIDRLAQRQAFLERRIEHLLGGDVCERLLSILAELSGRYGGRCKHGHEIDVCLTQQELAEMTGASRPTVSSLLNRLRALGVVSYTRHYICIESLDMLARISSEDIGQS